MMKYRAYQIGLGQQMERPDFVMRHIRQHAEWGYNILFLYLEGAFRFPSHPEFAVPNAWTPAQMKKVVECASKHGIGVIPVVPSLGHMAYCLNHPKYKHLGENWNLKDEKGKPMGSGQICPSLDGTYSLLEDLYRDILPYCTAGYLHVSLDESFDLGKCPKCKKRSALKGGLGKIFLDHLQKIHGITSRMGVRAAVWGDMFYYFPEIISKLPKDVSVFDWYYYPFKRYPRVELHNFHEIDSVGRLKKAGLEVWGSANIGPFFREFTPRFKMCLSNTRDWWRYGGQKGCDGLLITSWMCPYSGAELNVLGNACAAELWLGSPKSSVESMIKKGLKRFYGPKATDASQKIISILEDEPFCNFWNWQIITSQMGKMATLARPGILSATGRQMDNALKIVSGNRMLPTEIRGAVILRDYYHHKELLVRCGSGHLLNARQAFECGRTDKFQENVKALEKLLAVCERKLPAALKATNETWKQTRHPKEKNPLDVYMKEDAVVYSRIRKHLGHCHKNNSKIMGSCDILSSCQLLFNVRIRKPCLQWVEVFIAGKNGKIEKVHGLSGIEFSEAWANQNSNFVRRHSIPLPDSYLSREKLTVRLVARGVGEMEISDVVLLRRASLERPSSILACKGTVRGAGNLLRGGSVHLGKKAKISGFSFLDERAPVNAITVAFQRCR